MGYRVVCGDIEKDRERFLSFWNSYHDQGLDRKFRWLYEGNIDGVARFWLLEHEESGEIEGVSALFPRTFIVQEGCVKGGIAGDLFVSPNHRTLGPALMLQKAVLKGAKEERMDFVLAFSNKYAELIDKRIGYEKIGHLVRLVGVVRSSRALLKLGFPGWAARILSPLVDALLWCKFSIGTKGGCAIRELESVGVGYEPFWQKLSNKFRFVGDRSGRYMNWKYGQDPDDDNGFMFCETQEGGVEACLVYRRDANSYEIREFLPGPETTAGKCLLKHFFLKARSEGMDSVVVNPLGGSELAKSFMRAGFVQAQKGRAVMLYAHTSVADRLRPILSTGDGVFLLKGDEDS